MAVLNNQRVIDGNYGYFTSSQLKWAADVGLTKHLELSSSKANSVARLGVRVDQSWYLGRAINENDHVL